MLTAGRRFGLDEKRGEPTLDDADLREGLNSVARNLHGTVLANLNGRVDAHVRRPIDRRTADQRRVGLTNIPSRKGPRQARIGFSRFGHENNAGRSRIKTMMDKHAMADMFFNLAREARPIHVKCLVSGKSGRFVCGDQPLVFK
ncbi:MAG: hypothetical protein ABI672_09775 [Vicinamibacteria bacterium]